MYTVAGGKMKDKIKEAAFWAMAIFCTTAIVAMFWGGVAVLVMGAMRYLGGE